MQDNTSQEKANKRYQKMNKHSSSLPRNQTVESVSSSISSSALSNTDGNVSSGVVLGERNSAASGMLGGSSASATGCFGDGVCLPHFQPRSSTSDEEMQAQQHRGVTQPSQIKKQPPPKKLAEAEELLLQDFADLSLTQKRNLDEEVNGNYISVYQETEEFVSQSIKDMDEEIRKIRLRSCFDRAKFLAPHLVNDKDFRLMFLRSTEFNARKAAQLIVRFYEFKAKLFGEDKLIKKITVKDDFDKDDLEALESGAFQILPCPDRHGRRISFFNKRQHKYKSIWNFLRVVWFCYMKLMESDVTAQRRGIILIQYEVSSIIKGTKAHNDDEYRMPPELYMYGPQLANSLPYRVVALHYCYDKAELQPAIGLLRMLGSTLRCRFREHYGAAMECLYELMKFGIAPGIVPVDDGGNYRLDDFRNFLAMIKQREEEEANEEESTDDGGDDGEDIEVVAVSASAASSSRDAAVLDNSQQQEGRKRKKRKKSKYIIPTNLDVLMGRGRPYQDHKGNMFLSKLVDLHRDEYNESSRFDKTRISWTLVNMIKERGGRFLKKSNTANNDGVANNSNQTEKDAYWEVCSLDAAREKVAHGFRTRQPRIATGSQPQKVPQSGGKKRRIG